MASGVSSKAQGIINNHALAAAAAAVPGAFIPAVDIAAISGIWINLIFKLGEERGARPDDEEVKKFVISLLTGAGVYYAGCRIFTLLLSYTGVGTVAGVTLNAALNYLYTNRMGRYVYKLYDHTGVSFGEYAKASVAGLIFALPAISEIVDAINSVLDAGDLSDAVSNVDDISSVGDVTDVDLSDGDLSVETSPHSATVRGHPTFSGTPHNWSGVESFLNTNTLHNDAAHRFANLLDTKIAPGIGNTLHSMINGPSNAFADNTVSKTIESLIEAYKDKLSPTDVVKALAGDKGSSIYFGNRS